MNSTKIHLLRTVAALLLCAVVASCSQCEFGTEQGESLKPGQYPLSIIASVDAMTSRAAGHDSWVDGDTIGVRIGEYPKVGCYMLNADGTVMSAVDALDWQTIHPTTVRAWYPYVGLDEVMTVPIDDQTDGLDAYDFLTAIAENQIYTNSVRMNFKHRMAKVSCVLVPDDGISDEELRSAKVSFAGYTLASFSNGVLTGSYKDNNESNKWITSVYDADHSDYEALIVPQDMTGKELIKIDLDVNSNNNLIHKALIYTAPAGIADFQAGKLYKFTVTVKKDRLEVKSVTAAWDDADAGNHPAEPAIFRVNLPANINFPLIYSDNIKEAHEDYVLMKGNRFEISYAIDDENKKRALRISGDSGRDEMTRGVSDDKEKYVFSYYVLSEEITLEYVEYVEVGDYYYADGSWGHPDVIDDTPPVGVVFKSGAGGYPDSNLDVPGNYDPSLTLIHGYAVALSDATTGPIRWGDGGNGAAKYGIDGVPTLPTQGYSPEKNPYTGYNYTKSIEKWGKGDAAAAALSYPGAPAESSGWYLPSVEQLNDMENIPNRAFLFTHVGGTDLTGGRYWSCIVGTTSTALTHTFNGSSNYKASTRAPSTAQFSNHASRVRAVLTF